MIEITSYLREEDGTFVKIGDVTRSPQDERYVDGALDLVINGVTILDTGIWDYIDQFWCYISSMIDQLLKEGEASTRLPDLPPKLTFRRIGTNRVLVTFSFPGERRATTVAQDELVDTLCRHGLDFLHKMSDLLPENSDMYAVAINQLADSLKRNTTG